MAKIEDDAPDFGPHITTRTYHNGPDGGPAYPQLDVVAIDRDGHGDAIEAFTQASGGMSLRDYFAGQALALLLAFPEPDPAGANCGLEIGAGIGAVAAHYAKISYVYADAMLLARKGDSHGE